jgi:flagellar hook protein FlgE
MSINSAMLAGVSGLISNSSALAAISDNIANVNTTAYKRQQVNFANVVTSQAVKGRYSAGGVQAVTRQYVAQQGLIQSATQATDLGISGDGFFVVSTKGANLGPTDPRAFTRSGSFAVDADGYMVNDAKLYLQGWPVAADGTVNANPSDLSSMDSINVKDLGGAVRATSNVIVLANLDKGALISPAAIAATPGDPTTTPYDATSVADSMAGYAANNSTGVKPDFNIPMNIVDSAGGKHSVNVSFLKSEIANEWLAEIYVVPASDVINDGTMPPGQIASGIVKFTPSGEFDEVNSTLFGTDGGAPPIGNAPKIVLGSSADDPLALPAGTSMWATGLGISASDMAINFEQLTQQNAAESTIKSVNPDGATRGEVIAVEIDDNGIVSAIFDNNEVRKIAQIGLATFPNPDGLKAMGGNAYQATINSGEYSVKQPKLGGAGEISSGTLEASTVDLSAEFTGLIVTQKAYSASSKIITTADQMLEELINIKR